MSLCPCRKIINVILPMSDGEGAFLFCAPGYESSSHERRRAVLCRKQNGDPLFLPPTNSLTPRSFSFSQCWRISTLRASPWLSTPYKGNAALLPAERGAAILAACRWLSETRALVFIENDAEFLLRRLPQDILSTHYHDDEGHIRALLEASGLCPRGGTALAAAVRGLMLRSASCIRRSSPCCSTGPAGRCFNRGRLQRCGFSKGYRFAHSNQAFYPMVKSPCLPSHRKVRSWNVIVLFSHCPTPPDVFMIRRKLPRHKDAIYDR